MKNYLRSKSNLKIALFSLLFFAATASTFAVTYTWTGNAYTSSDFQIAANWSPARTTPATTDVLVFQGDHFNPATLQTITNVPTQTIGALQLSTFFFGVIIQLQAAVPGNTLTIGTTAASFVQAFSNSLDLSNGLNLTINVGATFTNANTLTNSGGGTITANGLLDFGMVSGSGTASQTAPSGITVNAGGELRFSYNGGASTPTLSAPSISGTLTVGGTNTSVLGTAPVFSTTGRLQYNGTVAFTVGTEWSTATPKTVIINDAAGISNSGARTLDATSADSLILTAGVFSSAAGLVTLPNNTVIARAAGSLSAAPTFGTTVNVLYNGAGSHAIMGPEIPTSSTVLNDLTVTVSGDSVRMSTSITVNGTTNGLKVTAGVLSIGPNTLTVTGVATVTPGTITGSSSPLSTLAFTGSASGPIGTVTFSTAVVPNLGTLNMSRTGTSPTLTIGSVTLSTGLVLGGGIVNMQNTSSLVTYRGTAANLSAGSPTSFLAFGNSQFGSGFILANGSTQTLSAGPYTLPIGTIAAGFGNPLVSGYRPVTLNFPLPPVSVNIQIDFFSDAGTGAAGSANNGNIPTAGNNRAGYFLNFYTFSAFFQSFTSVSASYVDADFNAGAPTIGNVVIATWGGSRYNGQFQASNSTSGTLRTITTNNFSGITTNGCTVALGVPGSDIFAFGSYTWTGNDFTSQWEDPGNWTGADGLHYPGLSNLDIATVTTANTPPTQPTITSLTGIVSLGQLNVTGAGSVVTLDPSSYLKVYGTTTTSFVFSGGGTLVADPTSTIDYADNHQPGFGGACPLCQTINSTITYGNLALSGSTTTLFGLKTIAAATSIVGNLTSTSNLTLSMTGGPYNTTVGGNLTMAPLQTVISNSTTTPVVLNGASSSIFALGTIASGGGINSVVVNGNATVTGSVSISNLTVNSAKSVSIVSNDSLRVTSLTNNGTINGPGRLWLVGTTNFPGAGTNNSNLDLYLTNGTITINSTTAVSSLNVLTPAILSLSGTNTITDGGTFQNTTSNGIVGPGTLQLLGTTNVPGGTSGAGTFSSTTIPSLTIGNGVSTNTVTAPTSITVNNFTVNAAATVAFNNPNTITVKGNVIGNGTNSTTGNTFILSGTGAQTISSTSPFAFNNLQYSNTGTGVSLLTNAVVSNVLTFSTNGKIATGANTLSLTSATPGTAISGANNSRYVNGNLQFSFPAGTTSSLRYEIGTASVYAPAILNMTGVTGAVSVTGSTATGTEPNENTPVANASGINQSAKAGNYWTMTKSGGGTFTNYDATFDFALATNSGTATNYVVRKFDSPATWSATTRGIHTISQTQALGLTNFSEFEVGEPNTAPVIGACPSNITQCDNHVATWTDPTSTGSPAPAVSCSPVSGSTFSTGTTSVTCTSANINGSSSCSFNVTINETPVIGACPSDITTCNPVVTFATPSATGAPAPTVTCTPASGSTFAVGTTSVTCTATNSCGSSSCSFNVTVNTPSTAATSATSNALYGQVCSPSSVTLTENGGSLGTGANWVWYDGACGGVSVGNGATLTLTPSVGSHNYFVRAEGTCGNTACQSVAVNVITAPPSGTIHYTASITDGCVGAPAATFTVNTIANCTFYNWSSTAAGVRFNGNPSPFQTTVPTVNVTFVSLPTPGTSGWSICVFGGNACGNTNTICTWVRATLSAPTGITGSVIGCPSSNANPYSSTAVAGAASYQWSSTNGIVINGNGSQSITVDFPAGFVSGTLSVHGQSICGYNGPDKTITITRAPATPGVISGTSYPCPNASTPYGVVAVPGAANYTWTTSVPGAIVTGTSNTCSILFPATIPNGSSVSVVANSSCPFSSAVRSKGIASGMPGVPASINGPATGQCGQTGVSYSITPMALATGYNWSTTCGTIVGPTNLSGVTVDWPASFTTCTLSVSATNSCGTGTARILAVAGAPAIPGAITGNAAPCANTAEFYSTAGSAGATSYIWTVPAGAVILGPANGASILVQWGATSGNITVRGSNACGNSAVRSLPCVISCRMSQVQTSAGSFNAEVYPNPASDKATVKFTAATAAQYHLNMTDVLGQNVLSLDGAATEGINMIELNLGSVAKGVYQLSIMSSGNTDQIRLVVQ